MFSYWSYILIGNNNTGKTTFQKYLIRELCGIQYKSLPLNKVFDIVHPQMPRGVERLFAMNRSYQEKASQYRTVANFFKTKFREANICVLSSHVNGNAASELQDMMRELRERSYNVAVVFFSNGFNRSAKAISLLDWDERLWVENPKQATNALIDSQIEAKAKEFANFLIARAAHQ